MIAERKEEFVFDHKQSANARESAMSKKTKNGPTIFWEHIEKLLNTKNSADIKETVEEIDQHYRNDNSVMREEDWKGLEMLVRYCLKRNEQRCDRIHEHKICRSRRVKAKRRGSE